MSFLFWILLGYLAGSFPTGYLAARAFRGVDIRTFGSGNVGATNVGRLMGKKWAVAVTL
jgi:glycerol-3-phosphate acyltransferase PlsY